MIGDTIKKTDNEKSKLDNLMEKKWELLKEFHKSQGLFKEHVISFNHFLDYEINRIVEANSLIDSELQNGWYFKYLSVRIDLPKVDDSFLPNKSRNLTPMECRLRNMTYSSPMYADVEFTYGHNVMKRNMYIGQIPIMLKSSRCHLNNKTEKEMEELKECPLDPGGYFIINGTERVLLMQEQIMNNRMILDQTSDGNYTCGVVSSTYHVKSRTVVIVKGDKIYLQHSSLTDLIPIMIAFKALGITDDYHVCQMIGHEDDILSFLLPSIEEAFNFEIYYPEQAIKFLAKKIKVYGHNKTEENLIYDTMDILKKMILAHIPAIDFNFKSKALYMGLMTRKVIQGSLGLAKPDDKDFYGNKRIELAGSLMGILFEDLFKKFNTQLKKRVERMAKLPTVELLDASKFCNTSIFTVEMASSIGSGNWNIQRFNMRRAGITQVLSRLSFIACLGMMTRINSLFEKTRKVSGPRSLQPSQWGMVCPSDTPEGEGCGLIKNMSLSCHITIYEDSSMIHKFVFLNGCEDINSIYPSILFDKNIYFVFINGNLFGYTSQPQNFISKLRKARRCGKISPYTSVSYQDRYFIVISTEGGRVCRPYIIVSNSKPLLKEEHLYLLNRNEINFQHLTKIGIIEFLDVNEENDALIAIDKEDICNETTHMEIAPFSILGVCAGLVPFPHHNQSPRNTYQCAMGKQAMGTMGFNQNIRMDTLMYLLANPQEPMVKTKTLDLVGYRKLPAGQNSIVAVMSYSAYDIEDALILNRASLDRAFGRCMVYRREQVSLKSYPNHSSDLVLPPVIENNKRKFGHINLDDDGICEPGTLLNHKNVMVNKYVPKNLVSNKNILSKKELSQISFKEVPLNYKYSNPAYVDKVLVTSNNTDKCLIKIKTRETRRPELGDKFSSRHGQKGVIGMIFRQEDMPFTESGICPDIIMNPHGFPSRMTVGKLIELLSGKVGAINGNIQDATAFEEVDVNEICGLLEKAGYHKTGKEILISGITGEIIPAFIYFGPIYYQKLKHMVADKIHARSRGSKTILTRQPTEGRAKGGGLRLGEMERDCLVGYGASMMIQERLMISSDKCVVEVCNTCGLISYLSWCNYCKSPTNISSITMPYAYKLLVQELISLNVVPRIKLKSYM